MGGSKSDGANTQSLDSSEEEHFSDASEGKVSRDQSVPTTRVERTDDVPRHGEVPGTAAHEMRKEDAEPDEVEILSESTKDVKGDAISLQIPKTVIDKVDPETPSHGEEPGTAAFELRKADAQPDAVYKAPEVTRQNLEEVPTSLSNRYEIIRSPAHSIAEADWSPAKEWGVCDSAESNGPFHEPENEAEEGTAEDEFDDFEEGDEADEFGTFDEGGQDAGYQLPLSESSTENFRTSLPLFDFQDLKATDEIVAACEPYIAELFPDAAQNEAAQMGELAQINPAFLTERSQSLWEQLVAPPPLQPPNWIKSRIRRLFLVSLGVPVDLDEILPASKQKKLILPSIEIEDETGHPASREPHLQGAAQKLKQNNASAASLNSTRSKSERRKKGPAPPPALDLNLARRMCMTTDAALRNFTAAELKQHVGTLDEYKVRAGKLLEYWLIQRDSANGDKEAFEEVIENTVKHAKKIRK